MEPRALGVAQAALADLRRVVVGLRTAEAPPVPLATDGIVASAEVDDAIAEAVTAGVDTSSL